MKNRKGLLACFIMIFTIILSLRVYAADIPSSKRIAGSNRYSTAVEISKEGWQTSNTVIIATGENFPDALCAAPLAKQLNAPILLTDNNTLNANTSIELTRLIVNKVYIIGGPGVVSDTVKQQIESKGITCERIFGNNRYATSIEVAKRLNVANEIVVATGNDFPDALSIAPIAAKNGNPIILTDKTNLPDVVKTYINSKNITKSYIIGGTGVITDNVKVQLPSPERIYGTNRYETNIAILNRFNSELNFATSYLATGSNFPDALAGSALAPKFMSPIILTDKTPGTVTKNYVSGKLSSITSLNILGGTGVIPNTVIAILTTSPIIVDPGTYNLDTTGITDTSVQFQAMIDSFPSGSTIELPKGIYKLSNIVKFKDNITLIASNEVIINGIGNNTLFSTGNSNSFQGIEFQNCSTALSVFQKTGVNVVNCRFTNNINYAAINFYGGSNCSVTNSYFYDIHKYGILIDNDSSDITIDNNSFDNATAFDGYSSEQISGHVYCLNGTRITVSNNIIKNSGGQGIIFGYNSTTGKGTTSSVASNNQCIGNGQEGITIYGGRNKVANGNRVIDNTSINNRFNQIEVWQSNNNTVSGNTVEESIFGRGSLGAICLFATTGTTCTGNNVLSSQSNGIAIIAGTTNTTVSDNFIADTNRSGYINIPEKGNGILLDWNGVADPQYITITNNTISSSNGIIAKSGIYSTSNTNHHNKIDSNVITGYKYGVHWYALATCGI